MTTNDQTLQTRICQDEAVCSWSGLIRWLSRYVVARVAAGGRV